MAPNVALAMRLASSRETPLLPFKTKHRWAGEHSTCFANRDCVVCWEMKAASRSRPRIIVMDKIFAIGKVGRQH